MYTQNETGYGSFRIYFNWTKSAIKIKIDSQNEIMEVIWNVLWNLLNYLYSKSIKLFDHDGQGLGF